MLVPQDKLQALYPAATDLLSDLSALSYIQGSPSTRVMSLSSLISMLQESLPCDERTSPYDESISVMRVVLAILVCGELDRERDGLVDDQRTEAGMCVS